jgi:hypothetical protein
VLALIASCSAWQLPLGCKDGVLGAERVPTGAYLVIATCFSASRAVTAILMAQLTPSNLDCSPTEEAYGTSDA